MTIEYKYELESVLSIQGEEVRIVARGTPYGKPGYVIHRVSPAFSEHELIYNLRPVDTDKNRIQSFWESCIDLNTSDKCGVMLYENELNFLGAKLVNMKESEYEYEYEYELGSTFIAEGEVLRIVARTGGNGYLFEKIDGDFEIDGVYYYDIRRAYFHSNRSTYWKETLFDLSGSNKTGVHLYETELSNLIKAGAFKLKTSNEAEKRQFKVGDQVTVKIGNTLILTTVNKIDDTKEYIYYQNNGHSYWAYVDDVSHRAATATISADDESKTLFKVGDPITVSIGNTLIETKVHAFDSVASLICYVLPADGQMYWSNIAAVSHREIAVSIETPTAKNMKEKDMSSNKLALGDYVKYFDHIHGDVCGSVVAVTKNNSMVLLAMSSATPKDFGLHTGISRISNSNESWISDSRFETEHNFHNGVLETSIVKKIDRPFSIRDKVEVTFWGTKFQTTILGTSVTELNQLLIEIPGYKQFENQILFQNVNRTKWNVCSKNHHGKHVAVIHSEYLKKLSPNSKENDMDKDSSTAVSFVARQKSRVAKGVYRAEARQLAKGTRAILVAFLKSQGFKRGEIKFATALLENPMGLPFLSWGIGELINRIPHLRDNPHCKILEEELQVEAFASGMDLGLDSIREKFEPMVLGILSRLPTPPAEMLRVTDAPKVRVSAPVNAGQPEHDMLAEQEALSENKKSATAA